MARKAPNKYKVPKTRKPREKPERKGCPKFTTIPFHLQIKVAEKMDYLDQRECQLSSNQGKDIVNVSKHKASIEVDEIVVYNAEKIALFINLIPRGGKRRYFLWSELRHLSEFPPIRLRSLFIKFQGLLSHVAEIIEKPGLVKNNLNLKCDLGNRNPIQEFIQLTEIFTIKNFSGHCDDQEFFKLPKFQEIPNMELYPFDTPTETLVKVKANVLTLPLGSSCSESAIQCFLQQWFRRERDIKRLEVWGLDTLEKESLFGDIPFLLIGECEYRRETKKFWMRNQRTPHSKIEECSIYEDGFICTVDRGDKNLLVIYESGEMESVIAQEYRVLKDIFAFKESDIRRIPTDE